MRLRSTPLVVALIAALLLLTLPPGALHAQASCDPWAEVTCTQSLQSPGALPGGLPVTGRHPLAFRDNGSELEVLAMNMALGAVASGIVATIRGRPVRQAVALGAVGGAVNFVGKSMVTRDFDGAGMLGRQMSAVGASLTRDAMEGTPPFRRIVFPLAVLNVHVNLDAPRPVTLKADLGTMIATGVAISRGDRFDPGLSLSSGTPVFGVDYRDMHSAGQHIAGVVRVMEVEGILMYPDALRHELVHVVQNDGAFVTWSEPVERTLFPLVPGLRHLHRFVDFGLQVPVKAYANSVVGYDSRPWEWEAGVLSGTWSYQRGSR